MPINSRSRLHLRMQVYCDTSLSQGFLTIVNLK
jgi:hypothetical protein